MCIFYIKFIQFLSQGKFVSLIICGDTKTGKITDVTVPKKIFKVLQHLESTHAATFGSPKDSDHIFARKTTLLLLTHQTYV